MIWNVQSPRHGRGGLNIAADFCAFRLLPGLWHDFRLILDNPSGTKKMSQGHHNDARRAFTRFFAALCLAGLAVGICLCLLQGQGAKSLRFAAAAQTYYARAQDPTLPPDTVTYLRMAARDAALSALEHNPADAQTWMMLSDIMLQNRAHEGALNARQMAENLGAEGDDAAPGFAAVFAPAQTFTTDQP